MNRCELNNLDIMIGSCRYHLRLAEDARDVDQFNYWMALLQKYQSERADLLGITLGCP